MRRSKITRIIYRNGEEEDLDHLNIYISWMTHRDYLTHGPIARRNVRNACNRALVDYDNAATITIEFGESNYSALSGEVQVY